MAVVQESSRRYIYRRYMCTKIERARVRGAEIFSIINHTF